MDLQSIFDKCFCISLERRQDRYQIFEAQLKDWPFTPVEKQIAIDGQKCHPRFGWVRSKGAWGCYKSHLRVLEDSLNLDLNSVLIMEDDAALCQDFSEKVLEFLKEVPQEWDVLYLGGEHLEEPAKISERVCKPSRVKRTHCYALRIEALKAGYNYLSRNCYLDEVDLELWDCFKQAGLSVYAPYPNWLATQSDSKSDIDQLLCQFSIPDCTTE